MKLRAATPPAIESVATGRLLFVTDGGLSCHTALEVRALARRLGGNLHVFGMLSAHDSRAGRRGFADGKGRRSTEAWLADAFALGGEGERVTASVVTDDFAATIAAEAARALTRLIILAPASRYSGSFATSLARASGVPVLVSRGQRPGRPVLTATDLRGGSLSVVHEGAELSQRLCVPLVALHHLDLVTDGKVWPSSVDVMAAPYARLVSVTKRLSVPATPLVRSNGSVHDSIFQEARSHDAGAIVVGTSYRSRRERAQHPSVADLVVADAQQSVLIVPVTP